MKVLPNLLTGGAIKQLTTGTTIRAKHIYGDTISSPHLKGKTVSINFNVWVTEGEANEIQIGLYNATDNAWAPALLTCPIVDGKVKLEGITYPNDSKRYSIYTYNGINGETLGISMERWNAHIAEGSQASDIWVPAESEMTESQRALMKYGEYKEIKSF